MATTIVKNCEFCDKPFEAKQADINRGWGKTCSKSCAGKLRLKNKGFTPNQSKRLRTSFYENDDDNAPIDLSNGVGNVRQYVDWYEDDY